MSCYHPLKAWPIGISDNGKTKYKVTSYAVHHIDVTDTDFVASTVPGRCAIAYRQICDYIEIPCGRCIGCRLDYSRDWANRCIIECGYHSASYFVTLTYNENHVPVSYYADPETGEALPSLTLCLRDVQNFFKRLRKMFPDNDIRYYLAGEYGEKSQRPHYHMILYGLPLNDLVPYKKSPVGFQYYTSDILQRAWSVLEPNLEDLDGPRVPIPIGFVVVSEVTWDTCAYTARYVMKKLKGDEAKFYETFNIKPPFTVMSRRPGIGRRAYDDDPQIACRPYLYVGTDHKGLKFAPPKYYRKLFELDFPDEAKVLKETRKRMADARKELKLSKTNLSYLDYLEVEEYNKGEAVKSLKRRLD